MCFTHNKSLIIARFQIFLDGIHSPISLLSVFFPIIATSRCDNDPLKIIIIGLQLIHIIVLVLLYSKVSYLTYTYIHFFFQIIFPYRTLQSIEKIFLCQLTGFINYLFYIYQCVNVKPNPQVYPSPTPSLLVTMCLYSTSVTQLLFYKQVYLYYFFKVHI